MSPPMVGVPFFLDCPESPRFLIDSPICLCFKNLMIFLPKIVEIKSDKIVAAAVRKEIYVNRDAPGI